MKIILDSIVFSLQQAGGISAYWYELASRLIDDPKVAVYEMPNDNLFRSNLRGHLRRESRLPVKLVRYLPFTKRPAPSFLFHSSYYRIAPWKSATNITTVHDFTYERFSSGTRRLVHAGQKRFAIRNSAGVICVSNHTKQDLVRFFPDYPKDRIRVIYNGVSEEFQPLSPGRKERSPITSQLQCDSFALFIGARGGYKNFHVAVKALRELSDVGLITIGGGPIRSEEEELLKPLGGRFLHFPQLETSKLNELYNNALCLVYPSSYEGFGIPMVEAMKAGCAVIATKSSSLPEVAGDAAILVEDISPDSLADAISRLQDQGFRSTLVQRGYSRALCFSWERCYRETLAFYQEVWDSAR